MKKLLIVSCFIPFLIAGECDSSDSDSVQRREQERLNQAANQTVGMPAIVNFQEKKLLKMIYELRDQERLTTYTYIVDMSGKLHKICNSIGFGVPAATQYTNPQRYEYQGTTLPQADPNGLFSPQSAEGTWVLCFNPETKKTSPTYIEPRVIVSTFPLVKDEKK